MRRVWIFGAVLLGGCVARVSNSPSPVTTTAQPVAVIPVEQPAPHPHGGPPGQDPNFVPPGHGGVPPGQAKKINEAAVPGPGIAAASPAIAADTGNEEAKPKEKEKKKVKAKAKKNK
jgi:hypothetical protein